MCPGVVERASSFGPPDGTSGGFALPLDPTSRVERMSQAPR
jgi:hypothetical protein